jgi:hypothetical protein
MFRYSREIYTVLACPGHRAFPTAPAFQLPRSLRSAQPYAYVAGELTMVGWFSTKLSAGGYMA